MIKVKDSMTTEPLTDFDSEFYLVLDVRDLGFTDDQFFHLCRDNEGLDIEMSGEGELIIMSPNRPTTSRKHIRIAHRLVTWSDENGTGDAYDSSAIFKLPNGARRSPDVAWILKSRWAALTKKEQDRFTPLISPDFVVEVRSPNDRMKRLRAKMQEYVANGVRLAWLLDPIDNRAYIYRPSEPVEEIEKPEVLNGDPVLPGFRFDFREIL
jgi:Uma2 family endonuclease